MKDVDKKYIYETKLKFTPKTRRILLIFLGVQFCLFNPSSLLIELVFFFEKILCTNA